MIKEKRAKIETGSKTLNISNEYASLDIKLFDEYPETICITIASNFIFNYNEKIKHTNVLSFIENSFSEASNNSFLSASHILSEKILPKKLKDDVIIITPEMEENRDYYLKKILKGGKFIFKTEYYIHTSNCLEKNSCLIKFFENDFKRQTEETNNLIQFCQYLINQPSLCNNKNFISKKINRK